MVSAPDLGYPVLQRLVALEGKLGELFAKLDAIRDLIAQRRKDHFCVEEIAELTGRSAYTIRRWVAEGKLTAIRLRDGGPRGRLLIPRTELERLIAAGRGGEVPDCSLVHEG